MGAFLFTGAAWARWAGIAVAVLAMAANFMWLPYYPFWALILIGLNVAVIWALAVVEVEPELRPASAVAPGRHPAARRPRGTSAAKRADGRCHVLAEVGEEPLLVVPGAVEDEVVEARRRHTAGPRRQPRTASWR